jgi:hypothetical protein
MSAGTTAARGTRTAVVNKSTLVVHAAHSDDAGDGMPLPKIGLAPFLRGRGRRAGMTTEP